tara:strand:- start:6834 stop:7553 length:720 start_codon:yes stop_codon:yes gene_type:complete
MSTERSSSPPKLVVVAAFGFGLLLFALAAQRVGAYYYIAHVPSEVDRALASGRPLSKTVLEDARQNYLAALEILPSSAGLQQNYGRLELRRAALAGADRDIYQEAMTSAAAHFEAAIVAAPSQAFSWSLESYALLETSAPANDICGSLRMSYFLGPHEASSILLRAQVASQSWEGLDGKVQGFIRRDFKAIWQNIGLRRRIVQIYLDAPLSVRVVIRDAIIENEADERLLNSMLLRAFS